MGTRFTRVTVVADGRRVDVSLPAQTPLGEQLPTVLRLLSVPTAGIPVRWRLAAPQFGQLEPSSSLDDVGVLDGTQLYLTEAAMAPMSPIVDDVESAAAELVSDLAPAWTGPARRSAVGGLLAIILLAGILVGLAAPAPVSWIAPIVVTVGALVAGRAIRESGGWFSASMAPPAATALIISLEAPATGSELHGGALLALRLSHVLFSREFSVAAVGALLVGLISVGLVRRAPAMTIATALLAAALVPTAICIQFAVPPERIAALGLVLAVSLSALAGRASVGAARLVDLMVADERGEAVTRAAVTGSARRGMATATGMIWAAAAIATAACWLLINGGAFPVPGTTGWRAPAFGVLGGIVFAMRSRMFTRARHVAPMLGVAVVAGVALALCLPQWWGAGPSAAALVSLLLLGLEVLVVGSALGSLQQVARARLQRGLDWLELIAVLALVPGLVVLFDLISAVTRWWS